MCIVCTDDKTFTIVFTINIYRLLKIVEVFQQNDKADFKPMENVKVKFLNAIKDCIQFSTQSTIVWKCMVLLILCVVPGCTKLDGIELEHLCFLKKYFQNKKKNCNQPKKASIPQ